MQPDCNSGIVGKRPAARIGLEPTLSLRWFFGLLAVFLVAVGVDVYLSRTAAPVTDPASQRVEVTDFMAAVRAGELSAGQIIFRANGTGLADLTATRAPHGPTTAAATVRSTARLTDADHVLLREHRFGENDAGTLAT